MIRNGDINNEILKYINTETDVKYNPKTIAIINNCEILSYNLSKDLLNVNKMCAKTFVFITYPFSLQLFKCHAHLFMRVSIF